MEVELTEIDSSSPQRRFVLDKLPVMIGQSPDASVRLDDQWVSRQHCEINAVKGTLVVRDLGSILGTFVNGLNVTTAQLMPGDKLTIGETCFQVDYERPRIVEPRPRAGREPVSVEAGPPLEEEMDRRPARVIFFRIPRRLLRLRRKRRSPR